MSLTYPEILQTIGTVCSVVGTSAAVTFAVMANRRVKDVKRSVDDQTEHMKTAIKEQTKELKP